MSRRTLFPVFPLLLLLAAGCSDDDNNGSDKSVLADAATDASVDAAGPLVSISGDVFDAQSEQPAGAVKVSVDGTSRSTTTGSDGSFTLQVPSGAPLTLRIAKASYMTTLQALVPPAGGVSDLEIPLVPPALVDAMVTEATLPARDSQKGVVVVDMFDATGGEGATLSAANGGSLTFDTSGAAVASGTIIAGAQDTTLVFINVETGSTTVSLTGGCTLRYPGAADQPSEAGALTLVHVDCPGSTPDAGAPADGGAD